MYTAGSGGQQGSGLTNEGFHPSKRQIAGAAIGVLALVFILQNSHKATLRFLFFSVTTPVWIAFLLVLCAGAIVGYVGRGVVQSRRAKKATPPAGAPG